MAEIISTDMLIVGGGIAGLTAGAYLSRSGHDVLIVEKEKALGGLVNSFRRGSFLFDGGLRSIENSGIIFPMLKDLGIEIEFLLSTVSVGIEDRVMNVKDRESLKDYQALLNSIYPENTDEISALISEIKRIMNYMDILYGIDNPLFLDFKSNRKYVFQTLLPWLFKYLFTIRKIQKLDMPIEQYLTKFSKNQSLIDMIAQHFFKETPAFFALSYFSLYLEYRYPKGGTGSIPKAMKEYFTKNGGEVKTSTRIVSLDPQERIAVDNSNQQYRFKKLLWAADLKNLYRIVKTEKLPQKVQNQVQKTRTEFEKHSGGDSIFSLYLSSNLPPETFSKISGPHFFYTPSREGLSLADPKEILTGKEGILLRYTSDKDKIKRWLQKYFRYNTYEISIPVLRDSSLAPEGKSGLVISTLFDYSLAKQIKDEGWYEEFKAFAQDCMIKTLNESVYPGLSESVIDAEASTPLSIEKITGNSEGAITGWAFTQGEIPVIHQMTKVAKSVQTRMPNIFQAGQWSFSPSGFPISILTGKLAADQMIKAFKKDR